MRTTAQTRGHLGWGKTAGSTLVALGTALGVLALATTVLAHGRFPRLGQVVTHPTRPDVVVVRATFGLVVSADGGNRWEWICLPVMGVALSEDPTVAILGGGAIVTPTFDGLRRSDASGCNWTYPSTELTDVYVIDQAVHPVDAQRSWVVTSSGVAANSVYETRNGGESWEPTSPPIDEILFETIDVAPSSPDRLYLSGSFPPTMTMPRRVFAYRSNDSGATWESFAFPLQETDRNLYLLGVDPRNPDRVLARVRGENEDRLIQSENGAETWSDLLVVPDIAAFVWSEDGATVFLGGIEGTGLHRSTDGAQTFSRVGDWEVSCVGLRDGEPWLCGNDGVDQFALGRLRSDNTVEPLLRLADVTEVLTCGPSEDTTAVCESELPELLSDLGGGGVDGGVVPPNPGSNGCSSGGRASSISWAALLLLLCGFRGRRRSRGHCRRPRMLARVSGRVAHFFSILVLGMVGTMVWAPSLRAQGMVDRQQARIEFERGVARYEAGAFTSALEAFQSAYRIAPHPSVRVNIANCYERLDRPVEALFHFQRFLEEAEDVPAAQREEVQATVTRLQGEVGEVAFHILPDGAEIQIDGADIRRAPILEPLTLRAGNHTLEVRASEHATVRRTFTVPQGDTARVSVALQPATEELEAEEFATEATEETPVATRNGEDRSFFERIGVRTYVAAGITMALLTGTVVTGILALSARSDFDASTARSENPTLSVTARRRAYEQSLSDADRANGLALATDALGVASLVGVGVTAALLALELMSDPENDAATEVAASPAIGPGGGGVRLMGRF